MTDAKISPLPWCAIEVGETFEDVKLYEIFTESGEQVAEYLYAENAEFVVRAVNGHAELVAALEAAVLSHPASFEHKGTGRHDPVRLPDPEWVTNAIAILVLAKGGA